MAKKKSKYVGSCGIYVVVDQGRSSSSLVLCHRRSDHKSMYERCKIAAPGGIVERSVCVDLSGNFSFDIGARSVALKELQEETGVVLSSADIAKMLDIAVDARTAYFGAEFHRNYCAILSGFPLVTGPESGSLHEVMRDGMRGIGLPAGDEFHAWVSVPELLARSDLMQACRVPLENLIQIVADSSSLLTPGPAIADDAASLSAEGWPNDVEEEEEHREEDQVVEEPPAKRMRPLLCPRRDATAGLPPTSAYGHTVVTGGGYRPSIPASRPGGAPIAKGSIARHGAIYMETGSVTAAMTPKHGRVVLSSGADATISPGFGQNLLPPALGGLALPGLVVLDLDDTCWSPALDAKNNLRGPPFRWCDLNRTVVDCLGKPVQVYPEVPTALLALHGAGVPIAVASHNSKRSWCDEVINSFVLDEDLTWGDLIPQQLRIIRCDGRYWPTKTEHLKGLQEAFAAEGRRLEFSEMLFFDDTNKCCKQARQLGAAAVRCVGGLTMAHLFEGLRQLSQ